jgi:Toprim domain
MAGSYFASDKTVTSFRTIDRDDASAKALALWDEATPLPKLALGYFSSRKIDVAAISDVHSVLRFHSRCPFGRGERQACIIALWTDAITAEPRAIHRTALSPVGAKLGRMSLGPNVGCVIRLWPDEAVTGGLVVGEGIETALAAATHIQHRGTVLAPAWATGDAGHLAGFPVLPEIEVLTILVDHDENGRGQCAADKCAQRWTTAGRDVIRLIPRNPGEDFADLVEVLA